MGSATPHLRLGLDSFRLSILKHSQYQLYKYLHDSQISI
jgi:hypothetical protein